jgi:hypothetical protein
MINAGTDVAEHEKMVANVGLFGRFSRILGMR